MACIRKRGKTWQAIVRIKGFEPVSATRATKKEVELWALHVESDMKAGRHSKYPKKTFQQAMDRYSEEESTKKRSGEYEAQRFIALAKNFPELARKQFSEISTVDIAAWRDARLKVVTPGAVQRDFNLMRHLWNVAHKEWGWCGENPWSGVRAPGNNQARQSVWKWQDIRAVLRQLDYVTGLPPNTKTQEIGYAFLLSIHTGMRLGELMGLTKSTVDIERRVVRLPKHKTMERDGVRHVAITQRAARILGLVHKYATGDALFTVAHASVDTLFRRARDAVLGKEKDLTFHDARATFATLMARKVDPLTLAKLLGHKDMNLILSTYYRESAAQIAARL